MIQINIPFSKIQDLFPGQKIYEVTPFKMYYSGWEGDEWGYAVSFYNAPDELGREYVSITDKSNKIVLTNHGTPYVVTKEKMQKYKSELEHAVYDIEYVMHGAGFMDYKED